MTEHSLHDEEEFVEDVVEATGVGAYVGGIVVALFFIVAIVVVVRSGLIGHVGDEDRLRDTVEGAGVWAPVLFVGLMVLLVPLNVPGVLFVIPSTAMFGTLGGIVLSLVGGFLASAIGVVAARRFGRAMFESRLPPRIRKLEQRISQRGFLGVALARCFTYLTQPVDWLCGLTSIPLPTVLAATFVGLIPPTVVIALSGGGILDLVL
jgi:uncharacterized membrane protein YdjX (TVP38/TMEM64 family)